MNEAEKQAHCRGIRSIREVGSMSNTKPSLPEGYASLLAEVKEGVRSAQYAALCAVNKELVDLYWDIGRMIVSRQSNAAHGDAIAEQLAADLRHEFPGLAGIRVATSFI